jgi:hypothetical protein
MVEQQNVTDTPVWCAVHVEGEADSGELAVPEPSFDVLYACHAGTYVSIDDPTALGNAVAIREETTTRCRHDCRCFLASYFRPHATSSRAARTSHSLRYVPNRR